MIVGSEDLFIKNGSKIAVIGAGPAGSFFANFAMHLAQERGLNLSIVLFDGKNFTREGPQGCNMCAGVISETLVNHLEAQGIVLPEEKVQRKIEGYYHWASAGGLFLKHPMNEKRIIAVFRGNGPRLSSQKGNISFDDYLLEQVRRMGLEVINKPVNLIQLPLDPKKSVRVIYGIGKEESTFEADLVVGAFGLSATMMAMMQKLKFGYKPPRTLNAMNVEIRLDNDFIQKTFGNNIFAYNWSTAKVMRVASIIPKKDYITINLIGKMDMKKDDLEEFLNFFRELKKLPENWEWTDDNCLCSPKLAITAAKKPFTNRLVLIGDASCCRYYKNGIESAFITAHMAADTAFNLGTSESAFEVGYFKRIKKIIIEDNFYGRILFKFNDLVSGRSFLSEVMLTVARKEKNSIKNKRMRSVLWNMYTGNIPYRTILLKFLNPILQWKLTITTFKLIYIKFFSALSSLKEKRGK